MPVAYDAGSSPTPGTGNLSWTHTPVGTPKGIMLCIIQNVGSGAELSVDPTYGGVSMVAELVDAKATGEPGGMYFYTLKTGVPAGAQTVLVTVSGASVKAARAWSVTADGPDTYTQTGVFWNSDSLANPTSTILLEGKTCFVAGGFLSGAAAITGITPFAGWTSDFEHDFGAQVAGFYRYNTVSNVDVSAGWTQAADDALGVFFAIAQAPGKGPVRNPYPMNHLLVR